MQINDVRPDSGLLVLTSRRGEQLPLEVGVPFLAEVLEQDGERTLLSLAGRLLRCTTDLPLQPGTSVWLSVREASPQRVVLALFDPATGAPPADQSGQALPQGTAARPGQPGLFESPSLTGPPGQPGLPALPDLPFPTPAPSPTQTEALARAVSFLLSNGRPATQVAVEAVVQLLAHEPNLAEVLTSLAQQLPASQPGLPAPLVEQVRQALANAFFVPAAAGDAPALTQQAAALEAVIHQLGLDHETRVGAFLLAEALADQAAPPTAGPTEAEPPPPAESPSPPAAGQSGATPPGEPAAPPAPPETSASPAQTPVFPLDHDLKGLLLALRRALTGQTRDEAGEPPVAAPSTGLRAAGETAAQERLVKVVDEVLQNLTGQRLAAPAAKGDDRLQLYLQIPVTVGEQRHTAELRVFREPHGRGKARPDRPAALRVSCRLATANLGPVRVDLALRPKGSSEAHLYLAAAPVAELFRRHEEEFREVLSAAGFHLGRVAYSVASPSPLPSGTVEPGGPAARRFNTVDLRL